MPAVLEPRDVRDASDFKIALRAFRPLPRVRTLDWCIENIVNEQGRPYDAPAFPHLGAPGGPMDANDDDRIREISLMWGTRLGKSFVGQCTTIKNAATNPAPQMMLGPTEKLTKEIIQRTYTMVRARAKLNRLLVRPLKFQRQDLIEFRRSRVFAAWARSVSTLADKNIKYGHAAEIDKAEHQKTSKEADPLKLFTDRFKDYWASRKILFESTPTVHGESRIERRLLAGTNCRFHVPCKKCRRYQTLILGKPEEGPGIRWEKPEGGRSDGDLARQTAYYQCAHCPHKWRDHERAWSIRRGVWAPAGCAVKDKIALKIAEGKKKHTWSGWRNAPWIEGKPLRDGDHASYQLSSLYALSLTWGDIAREFVECKDRPQLLRNFKNSWEGEVWHQKKIRSTPQMVGDRLRGATPRNTAPSGAHILGVAIDRQGEDTPYVVYGVLGMGLNERAWLVEYGIAATPEDTWDSVIRRHYPHADGGAALQPVVAVIDSGFKTHETYLFCQSHPGVLAVKGSTTDLGGAPYKIGIVGADGRGSKTGVEGQQLMHVNTDYWETELQARLDERSVDGAGSLVLCPEASRDPEFLEQLLNGTLSDVLDKRGNPKMMWIKKDEHFPNDFRDVLRYALCALRAWLDDHGGAMPLHAAANTAPAQKPLSPVIYAGDMRPDGRGWLER